MAKIILFISLIFALMIQSAFSIPFPETVYQVPICATSFKALSEIRKGLESINHLNKGKAEEYIQEQIEKGNIVTANKLLKELKEQYRKGLKSSSQETLIALQERLDSLEQITLKNSSSKASLYPSLVVNVSQESLSQTQSQNINSFRKLCNGGKVKPEYPFSVFEFVVSGKEI